MTPLRAASVALLALACGHERPTASAPSATTTPRVSGGLGVFADGHAPATAALQAAVDALPPGGVLHLPPGTYRIDAATGVRLKDGVRLDLGSAVIVGENVKGARCRLLEVDGSKNVVISGGTLVGSRSGSPAWGVGILASDAENLLIENVTLRDFYFDGILLTGNRGCRDVVVRGVVAEDNRRTGMAVPAADHVTVEDSTFRGTHGQSPEAGVNCEPNAGGEVRNVSFQRCTFAGNAGVGLYAHRAKGNAVSAVSVEASTVEDNGQGIVMVGVQGVSVVKNHVSGHRRAATSAIVVGDTTEASVVGNQLDGNFRGILVAKATGVQVRGNTVVGMGSGVLPAASTDANGVVCLGPAPTQDPACVVSANTIRGCAGSGVVAQLVSVVRVLDNTIEQTGQRGVLLRAASRSEVRGNSISTTGLLGADYAAIDLVQSSSDDVVSRNTIRFGVGTQRAIGVCPACLRNQVTGNTVLP